MARSRRPIVLWLDGAAPRPILFPCSTTLRGKSLATPRLRFEHRWLPASFAVLIAALACAGQIGHVLSDAGACHPHPSCPAAPGNSADPEGSGAEHPDGFEASLATSPPLAPPATPERHAGDLAAANLPSPFREVPPPIPISA